MKIYYFNLTNNIPTRDRIYLKALAKTGHEIFYIQDSSPGLIKYVNIYRKYRLLREKPDIVWVGYTAYLLVPMIRILTSKKIFFNAFSSIYEGMIISRKVGKKWSVSAIKYWVIDFISFHLSTLISAETDNQKKFLAHFFFLSQKKIVTVMSGADDEFFYKRNGVNKLPHFTVLFRGGFLPEAGVPCFIEAIKIIKESKIDMGFRIVGFGVEEKLVRKMIVDYKLGDSIELITEQKSPDELRKLMEVCHLSLGQLARHPRLERTIPHKAFESLALGLPYLTARTAGIQELLKENDTCICFEPGNAAQLAKSIISCLKDQGNLARIAGNGYNLYQQKLRSDILANKLLEEIK